MQELHELHEALQDIRISLLEIRQSIRNLHGVVTAMSATLADQIQALQADVTAENTVIDSAVALINGFAAQLAAAIAAATAAGATAEQLQALADLGTSINDRSAGLSAAVAANTPAAPPAP